MKSYSTPKDQWDFLIGKMKNIPEERREFTEANAKWFVRAGWVKNMDNPYLDLLLKFAKTQF